MLTVTSFSARHIGADSPATATMLAALGFDSVDDMLDAALPAAIRDREPLVLDAPLSEREALEQLRTFAAQNTVSTQMIGQGYADTVTPPAIQRGVLDNPAWYTAYTPYQAEISQGRLEALLNFQTVISDLTGLPTAGASLLDEPTAVAEAMLLMRRAVKGRDEGPIVLDAECLPQTIEVVRAQADAMGMLLRVEDIEEGWQPPADVVGVVLQQPGVSGRIRDLASVVDAVHEAGGLVTVAADLLSLAIMTPPGEYGADVAVGSAQRFGVPLFFGGPHAAFISVRAGLERQLPGRLVGVSLDSSGNPALRLALQTREQHIRRDRATSNICTAQALLAIVASFYAVYHGPDGLRRIAEGVHAHAVMLYDLLEAASFEPVHAGFFDTVVVEVGDADAAVARAADAGVNIRRVDERTIGISVDETTTGDDVMAAVAAVTAPAGWMGYAPTDEVRIPEALRRTSEYLTHPTFHSYRSETALMRYMRSLADKDLALDRTMIPLGSCTMKLNAAAEMAAITWPEFAGLHPYAPADQTRGSRTLIAQLEGWLARITGYADVSVQPNAGSRGEYAGLLAIAAYHRSRGEERDICLIPSSAHGTNAASAVLAGMKVAVVATAPNGTIDHRDLEAVLEKHQGKVAAIMITYPSTHGVYETDVKWICDAVHQAGGQVYIDGANLNALVGYARPGAFGGDVSHLNLHKTFAIPHGGGGPGVGPVAAAAHLAEFLPRIPGMPAADAGDSSGSDDPSASAARRHGPLLAGAPFGSAGVLPISWAYVAMMGGEGLTQATGAAVLAANYVAAKLDHAFPVLYRGPGGLVAHECILDLRPLAAATGITAEDVAKRLIDFGIHAPTMSFPVAGTLMVEPTESEDLRELDRFIDAMLEIRAEIGDVEAGTLKPEDTALRHAPHTAAVVVSSTWNRAYTREQAAFPGPVSPAAKYWPPVGRIDNAHGDRNLVCACPPMEEYQ